MEPRIQTPRKGVDWGEIEDDKNILKQDLQPKRKETVKNIDLQ